MDALEHTGRDGSARAQLLWLREGKNALAGDGGALDKPDTLKFGQSG